MMTKEERVMMAESYVAECERKAAAARDELESALANLRAIKDEPEFDSVY